MKHTRKNKSRRKKTGSKAFDRSCQNHGSCTWCFSNRTHRNRRPSVLVVEKDEIPDRYFFDPALPLSANG